MGESLDGLATLELDGEALRANYREIVRRVGPDVRMMPSIKADAYGFGAVESARIFAQLGAFALFTGSVSEALAIRREQPRIPIVMFGHCLPEHIPQLLSARLTPTVYNRELAEAVSSAAADPTEVYVKVDAGLGRLGVPLADAAEFIGGIAALRHVVVGGVYTHVTFTTAGGVDWARQRLAEFDALIDSLRSGGVSIPVTQARASACIAAGLSDRANAVCVGHALYGLSPFTEPGVGDLSRLRPVLRRLSSRLIHVGRHRQGADVAIGGLYGLRRGKTMGVLPVGMAHGLGLLREPERAWALVRGRRAPLVSISLEHTTLDLDGVADALPGDEVTLAGTGNGAASLDEFAAAQGRISLETMVNLAGRWQRRYADPVKSAWDAFSQQGTAREMKS